MSDETCADFWNKVAFYNFFQTPDGAVSSNEHTKKERWMCWDCWQKTVEILKPDICLFFTKETHRHFDTWNSNAGREEGAAWKWEKDVSVDEIDSNVKAVEAQFAVSHEKDVQMWFVYHPSRTSSEAWNAFLNRVMPDAMKWLK